MLRSLLSQTHEMQAIHSSRQQWISVSHAQQAFLRVCIDRRKILFAAVDVTRLVIFQRGKRLKTALGAT